jgi:hypothetical protein
MDEDLRSSSRQLSRLIEPLWLNTPDFIAYQFTTRHDSFLICIERVTTEDGTSEDAQKIGVLFEAVIGQLHRGGFSILSRELYHSSFCLDVARF